MLKIIPQVPLTDFIHFWVSQSTQRLGIFSTQIWNRDLRSRIWSRFDIVRYRPSTGTRRYPKSYHGYSYEFVCFWASLDISEPPDACYFWTETWTGTWGPGFWSRFEFCNKNRTESTRIHHGGSERPKNVNKFVRVICGMIFGHLRRRRRPVSHKAEPGPTGTKSWIWGPGLGSSVQKYQACGWSETLINTQNPLELPGMWFWICLEPLGILRAPASHKAQPGPTTGTSGPGSKIPSLWLFRDTQKHTKSVRVPWDMIFDMFATPTVPVELLCLT